MQEPDLPAFHDHAARLESYIADAERRGDEVPEEARAMLASLREITRAMNELRASLDPDAAAPDSEPTDDPAEDAPPA